MLRARPPAPLLFALAVLAHAGFLALLGHPSPGGPRADANVYLELGMNLWRDGVFASKVSNVYPPLYPMLLAPTFALPTNDLRFDALYALHAALLGLCSMALLPALREHLGPDRAWHALAIAQFAGGASLHGYNAQSEPLFTALLAASAGACWTAFATRRPAWFALLGALAGLSVCTREMGIVVPVAVAGLLALEVRRAMRGEGPTPHVPALLLAAGFVVGLAPRGIAALLHGQELLPYGEGAAASHLRAGARALASLPTALLALHLVLRHAAYLAAATFGAPLVLSALLLRRADPAPLPLRRAAELLLLVAAGLVALTTLHMVRYWLRPGTRGYDLYPRYMDPLEPAFLLVALVAGAWLLARDGASGAVLRARWLGPLVALAVAAVVAAGTLHRPRGGRILPAAALAERLDALHPALAGFAPFVFPALSVALLGAFALLARRRVLGTLPALAAATIATWTISWHSPLDRWRAEPLPLPAVLRAPPVADDPTAPIAVVVARPGMGRRDSYEPAFRSDHPVRFLTPREAPAWAAAHPEGFVLAHRNEPAPSLPLLRRVGPFRVHAARPAPEGEQPGGEGPGAEELGGEGPDAEEPGGEGPDPEEPGAEGPGAEEPGGEGRGVDHAEGDEGAD